MDLINYVVTAWTGPRRSDNTSDAYYINTHVEHLRKLKHNLDQITVVAPESPNNYLIKKYDDITYIERPNIGISYGSFSDAYRPGKFKYHILIEDDYVFVKDDFDKILIDTIEWNENCGYLCQLVKDEPIRHAAISNGIFKEECLSKIFAKYGKIPYHVSGDIYDDWGQLGFSKLVTDIGYQIHDVTDRYKAPFYHKTHGLQEFSKQNEYLWMPLQFITPRSI